MWNDNNIQHINTHQKGHGLLKTHLAHQRQQGRLGNTHVSIPANMITIKDKRTTVAIRNKRFFFTMLVIGAFAVIAAGTAYGIYNMVELERIKRSAHNVAAMQRKLTEEAEQARIRSWLLAVDLQSLATADISTLQHVQATDIQTIMMAKTEFIREQANGLRDMTTALINKRVNQDLLLRVDWDSLITDIHKTAIAQGYQTVVHSRFDILQCEASFIANKHGLDIIIHIPVARPTDVMEMYRLLPHPLQLSGIVTAEIDQDEKVIAVRLNQPEHHGQVVGKPRDFKIMDLETLNACRSFASRIYICKNSAVTRRFHPDMNKYKSAEACLFNIFNRNHAEIKKTCDWRIRHQPESMIQLNKNTFLAFHANMTELTYLCPDQNKQDTIMLHGSQYIQIQDHCWASTPVFTIRPDTTSPSKVHTITWHTPQGFYRMFGEEQIGMFRDILNNTDDKHLFTRAKISIPQALATEDMASSITTVIQRLSWGQSIDWAFKIILLAIVGWFLLKMAINIYRMMGQKNNEDSKGRNGTPSAPVYPPAPTYDQLKRQFVH